MNLLATFSEVFGDFAERYSNLIAIIAILLVIAVVLIILMFVAFGTDKHKFKDYDEDGFDDVYTGPVENNAPSEKEQKKSKKKIKN